ncbi:MAG: YncE family protein [Methylocella sp.]
MRNGSCAARVFMALWAMLAMGLAVAAEAAPFAYVENEVSATVSVIDTATNTVVGTPIPVGKEPLGVAVTPDGKHAYVANRGSGNVSVIDTATNMVVATVVVGNVPFNVAVTPDGKHAYVANIGSSNVSVIDTATNTVEPTVIMVGNFPVKVAFTRTGNTRMSRIISPRTFR